MGKYNFIDKASRLVFIGLTCTTINANTSMEIQHLDYINTPHSVTLEEGTFRSGSVFLAEYKIAERKLKVEIEAQRMFGQMREATFEEQCAIQRNIDKISTCTGVNFWD